MSRPSQNQRGVPLRVTVSTKPPPKEERRFLKRLDGIWHLAAPAPLSPRWLCGDGSPSAQANDGPPVIRFGERAQFHLCHAEYWDASPMPHTWIRDLARMLSPDRPIMFLAEVAHRPRSTAKSWATGHRRPPISVLKVLRETVRARGLFGLEAELDYHIRKREQEPKHRTGFWQIDPITGQNRANRFSLRRGMRKLWLR